MSELSIRRQKEICVAALVAAAEAAESKGVSTEAFFTALVESAMIAIAHAEGGMGGLAEWHRREYESLRAREAEILKARAAGYN